MLLKARWGLRSQMPMPENQIFPKKIREISRAKHLGRGCSRYQLITGIQDWLFPGLFEVGKHSGILKCFPINSSFDHFAQSWINSKVNGNHEITTQKWKRNFFVPHLDLNHGPLTLKASMLPMSYADPSVVKKTVSTMLTYPNSLPTNALVQPRFFCSILSGSIGTRLGCRLQDHRLAWRQKNLKA